MVTQITERFLWVNTSERRMRLNCSRRANMEEKVMQDRRRVQQCRGGKRRMWLSITPFPPLPLQPLQSPTTPSMKKKKPFNPPLFSSSSSSSSFPLPHRCHHPPPTPFPPQPLFPAPGFCCTNQEQMSAGAALKDPAVLDASHMLFIQR